MNISDYLCASKQTQIEFAKKLGVSQPMVGFWIHGKPPTVERAIEIERVTQGAVTCEELRPDLAEQWAYLRGEQRRSADAIDLPHAGSVDARSTIDDLGSGDPRHSARRKPERRSSKDRRADCQEAA